MKAQLLLVLTMSASLAFLDGSAAAQDEDALARTGLFARDRNIAVLDRAKPEYEPLPIRLGGFLLEPAISGGVGYDDNIYANAATGVADAIVYATPSLSVRSDWSRHQILVFARIDDVHDITHFSEDVTDYALGASARLDVHHDLGVIAGASFERDALPRTSEASPLEAARPVRYDLADAFAGVVEQAGRFRLTARGSIDDYSYDDDRTRDGALLYEQDLSHTLATGVLKGEYAYLPGVSLLTSISLNARSYRDPAPGEVRRDSNGYEAALGASFDLTHLARGEFYIGYLEQDYADSRAFDTIKGLAFTGKIAYFLSPITTATLSGERSVQDSGLFNVGGYLAQKATLQIDHEFLRNFTLSGLLGYGHDDYAPYSRTDRRTTERLAAAYLLNRALSINLSYEHLDQTSDGARQGVRFDINRLTTAVTCKF